MLEMLWTESPTRTAAAAGRARGLQPPTRSLGGLLAANYGILFL